MKSDNSKLANGLAAKLLGHLLGGTKLRAGLAGELKRELEHQTEATERKRLTRVVKRLGLR